ncbi:MAG: type II toxin-antitoxin system HicB family antitoxin [Candidatus Methanoperedens sp.]|nr:type II toxin-antitoxin system HicB family antitoxin [Candidatus Methanoperedens sp.]
MKHKLLNFSVIIEQDEDGMYIVKAPDIRGCYTQGKTIDQAMERIKEAIQVCIEADREEEITPLKFIGVAQLEVKV